MRSLNEITDKQCCEIAILEGWQSLWEEDRGRGNVTIDELTERGREIVEGEIGGNWVNYERVNHYLTLNGYECLPEPPKRKFSTGRALSKEEMRELFRGKKISYVEMRLKDEEE